MTDTFTAQKERMDEFVIALRYSDRASGLAAAIGGKIKAVDLFTNRRPGSDATAEFILATVPAGR